jgi:penicillin-binding protein 1B
MAAAYAAFANGGTLFEPVLITGADDTNGNYILDRQPAQGNVIKATTAYVITDMLQDVIARGTARKANGSIKGVALAGKTGTSRDGWFVGYTPNLVCAVWIGYDDNKQLGLTGAEAALPAWINFVKEAVAIRPSLGGSVFPKPGGIVTVKVDPESGFLAGPNCPYAETVKVSSQFAPVAECYLHAPEYAYMGDDVETPLEEQPAETGDYDLPSPKDFRQPDYESLPGEPVHRTGTASAERMKPEASDDPSDLNDTLIQVSRALPETGQKRKVQSSKRSVAKDN